jgi:hypothetical protein
VRTFCLFLVIIPHTILFIFFIRMILYIFKLYFRTPYWLFLCVLFFHPFMIFVIFIFRNYWVSNQNWIVVLLFFNQLGIIFVGLQNSTTIQIDMELEKYFFINIFITHTLKIDVHEVQDHFVFFLLF